MDSRSTRRPLGSSVIWDGARALQWRHNEDDGVSNYRRLNCFLNRFFMCRSKKTSKLRVTGLFAGNLPVTGEFHAQMASNAENVAIWWRHHGTYFCILIQPWIQCQSLWACSDKPYTDPGLPLAGSILSYRARMRHYLVSFQPYSLLQMNILTINSSPCLDRIYASVNRVSIISDNGLSPIWRQAII